MANNFQREGSKSNSNVGSDFETTAEKVLKRRKIIVQKNHGVNVGVSNKKKRHKFDLGSNDPPILVECKSHKWTKGENVPSAKMTVWNEAMYYFSCSPKKYRKILFVLRDDSEKRNQTLAQYYVRTYSHLIPKSVEIWEYDEKRKKTKIVFNGI